MAPMLRVPFTQVYVGGFLFLLFSMLFLFTAVPLLDRFLGVKLLVSIFFTALLISGIYAVSENKLSLVITLVVALLALAARWFNYSVPSASLEFMTNALGLIFSTYVAIVILSRVFRETEVTADVIYGAICVYLLMGVMWASLYALLEGVQPGSFRAEDVRPGDFIYYSFVTQTTLGYGDISPLSRAARSFSTLQAIVGQLYLAVLIARLVGIHIAQSLRGQSR